MNTMVQFAKRLAYKGVHVTITTTTNTIKQITPNVSSFESITLEPIYDDTNESNLHFKDQKARFDAQAGSNLAGVLIAKREQASNKKCLLVYHGSLHWALLVARQHNVAAAAFFTVAAASFAGYYYLYLESQGKSMESELPPMVSRLPDLLCGHHSHARSIDKELHPVVRFVLNDYAKSVEADFVLINSFDELEEEVVKWMSKIVQVKTIGPTLPSAYLDKQMRHDSDYAYNQYKPTSKDCIAWLNTKPANSVLYIAFGSVTPLSSEQMTEIAEALIDNSTSYLWVIRETELAKLPITFVNEMSGKGLVVTWAPQLDVLAHDAVGCFMSHCGWNSIIEALSFGVPVLAMPQFLDQFVDAHFVDQVWGVGIVPMADDKGFVTRQEIGRCLEEIIVGPRGRKAKENVAIWKELAREAMDKGGSSDKHIDEIIEWIASS